jgi:hypothetical protein
VPLISPKIPQGLDWEFSQSSAMKDGHLKYDGTLGEANPEKFICVLTVRHKLSNKLNPITYRLAIAASLEQIQTFTFARIGQVHTETFNCGSDN